jgi:peptidase M15-like protein
MTRAELLPRLQGFLDAAGIRHFRAYELCDVGRGRRLSDGRVVRLKPVPAALWGNILPTLRLLEWLRRETGGRPLHVTSGYRDPAYNWAVGGKTYSLHVAFNAVDFFAGHVEPRELAARLARHPEARKLGIGLYRGFVHLDTRGVLGHRAPARWGAPDRWWA